MDQNSFTSRISIIHMALFSGQLILLAVMLYLKASYTVSLDIQDDIYIFLVLGLAVASYMLGNYLYKARISSIIPSESFEVKLNSFRSAAILRMALIEAATLFAIIAYFFNGNFLFILVAFIMLIYFFMIKPSRPIIQQEAKLNAAESKQLG